MKIRTLTLTLMAMALAVPAFAQNPSYYWQTAPATKSAASYWQTTKPTQEPPKQDPKPETKPEAKVETKAPTPASLADNWAVSIDANGQTMEAALVLKADAKEPAKKVGGSITSPQGAAEIEGEIVAGKLTFWFTMNAGGGDLNVTFNGTVQKDGSLAGTLSFGQGDLNWTAVRVKK